MGGMVVAMADTRMYHRTGGFTVTRGTLPIGDAGTMKTLAIMRTMAVKGAADVEVRSAAINAVRDAGVRPHDHLGELGALFRFVRDRVHFVRDPHDVETLQSPRYTLEILAGDCDDRATLLAAMIRALGIPADVKFRVVAAAPGNSAFSHVYVVANLGGRQIPLDPTYADNQPGRQYARATRFGDFAL